MNTKPTLEDVRRLAIDDRADTLIYVVKGGTLLCAQLLQLMRSPDLVGPTGASRFERGWSLYSSRYAHDGGIFGALLSPSMKVLGPIVAMGAHQQLSDITKFLVRRSREITRKTLTPILCEPVFEEAVQSIAAELQEIGGSA